MTLPQSPLVLSTATERLDVVSSRCLCHRADAVSRISTAGLWFGPRDHLEVDPRFRQIIPYILLAYRNQYATYRRGKAGSEARLHGRRSCGFGGHIEWADAVTVAGAIDLRATIDRSAERELEEELGLQRGQVGRKTFLGLITSSDTPVDAVHLGWVELWDLRGVSRLTAAERSIRDMKFLSLSSLMTSALEPWSRLAGELLSEAPGAERSSEVV